MVNQKQPFENSLTTKNSAMLAVAGVNVPPVAGSAGMLWTVRQGPRRHGHFSEYWAP